MLLMELNVGKDEHELVRQHRPKFWFNKSNKKDNRRKIFTSMLSPLAIKRRALIAPPHGAAIFTMERMYFSLKAFVCR